MSKINKTLKISTLSKAELLAVIQILRDNFGDDKIKSAAIAARTSALADKHKELTDKQERSQELSAIYARRGSQMAYCAEIAHAYRAEKAAAAAAITAKRLAALEKREVEL